jgi:hypothetical protein
LKPNINFVDSINILEYNDKILHSMNKVRFRCLIFRVRFGPASHLDLHPPYILGSCTSTVTLSVWFGTAVLLVVVALVGDIWDLLLVGDALLLAWLPRREP